jgi:hypothetical protein
MARQNLRPQGGVAMASQRRLRRWSVAINPEIAFIRGDGSFHRQAAAGRIAASDRKFDMYVLPLDVPWSSPPWDRSSLSVLGHTHSPNKVRTHSCIVQARRDCHRSTWARRIGLGPGRLRTRRSRPEPRPRGPQLRAPTAEHCFRLYAPGP